MDESPLTKLTTSATAAFQRVEQTKAAARDIAAAAAAAPAPQPAQLGQAQGQPHHD